VKELLANGADPNKQDQLQHTPFMMAAWFGKIDAAREIFEKVCTVRIVCVHGACVSLCVSFVVDNFV
jgi:ankyrin repeat protein